MIKNLFIFLIIVVILLIAFWGYNYFNFQKTIQGPTSNNFEGDQFPQNSAAITGFRGPTGPPSVKGPTEPSPTR